MDALRQTLHRLLHYSLVNFLLTNCLPRRGLTRFMGWFSRVEQPLVRAASIAVWRFFADVDLADARKAVFTSLHDCFIRELRDGARRVDPDTAVLCSPCDAIVGQCGPIHAGMALQAKGRHYPLALLLGDEQLAARYAGGNYATLRLTAGMYHRFHAPHDCTITDARYIGGDVWNVNPPTLQRVEQLYCRNERAVIGVRLDSGPSLLLVTVAAVLVAGIRLHGIPELATARRRGQRQFTCATPLRKGQELGWFEHGSTIIMLVPSGMSLQPGMADGVRIRMGEALFRLPA